MIVRRVRNRDYTVVANALFRDGVLSFEAMGVAAYLLSKPDHWEISLEHLAKVGNIGRDKMQRIARELLDAHFLSRENRRDPETKAFVGMDYVMHDEPQPENQAAAGPQPEKPAPGKPEPENPVAVVSTDSEQILNPREREGAREGAGEAGASGEASAEADTRKLWRKMRADYPHIGLDQIDKAERRFLALTEADQLAAVEALPRWKNYLDGGRARPPVQDYIRDRRWELIPDALPPSAPKAGGKTDAAQPTFIPHGFADQGWWAMLWRAWKAGDFRSLSFRLRPEQLRYGWACKVEEAPGQDELGALIRVPSGSPEFAAWADYLDGLFHASRMATRLPRPDKAPFVWLPAAWPPGHGEPTPSEIDEVLS